jgi:hypothetical protein
LPGTDLSRGIGRAGSGISTSGAVLTLAAVAFGGCNPRERVEQKVWNLFSIQAALDEGSPVAAGPTLPEGLPAAAFLTQNADTSVTLKVQRAFAEGQPAAFVTTEVWVNYYDAVWLQPIYTLASAADPLTFVDAPRVIDVGPDSIFYSPFWQVSYAVIGDAPADGYRSSTAVLDGASEIIPGAMRTCPLRPVDIVGTGLALPPPWDPWNASITLQEIPDDGQAVLTDEDEVETFGLFDFGSNLFELERGTRSAVVAAAPMFLFFDAGGTPLTDEPRVLGAGPVGVDVASGLPRPRFGGLWRVYKATLPGTAGAFHGASHLDARDSAMRAGADPLDYEGRVALNATTCFDGDAAAREFPDGCLWLDSQAQLESLLGASRLIATEITQTGPIVLWHKQPVSR